MNIPKGAFENSKKKLFEFQRVFIPECRLYLGLSSDGVSIFSADTSLLEKLENQMNKKFLDKKTTLRTKLTPNFDGFEKFKSRLLENFEKVQRRVRGGQIEESVKKLEEGGVLLNKKEFLKFVKGEKAGEDGFPREMETSVINYNPNRNLSKVMSKSQLKRPIVDDGLGKKHFLGYIAGLCGDESEKERVLEMMRSYGVTVEALKRLIQN